ncbi:hypothetical protein [Streptomyces sp. NPDC047928]|uniref:hypothetical protein n=1 Tax=unclassified Streptomyces TaxID=2593676 RepID=UPI0037179D99
MLILRLHSEARAVDGTGGDEGRDLYEYTDGNELIVYEAKSFTGRMDQGRRAQVVKSLKSAARHQPDHWDLLVPIDPNPTEQRWFDSLRNRFPFVRTWHGRSWLDTQLAAHPDLVRYALQESSDYILERIVEARAERDVLLSVPDYLDRARALHQRGQEISPHYALHTELDAHGKSTVRLTPKVPGKGQEVIRVSGNLRFRADDQGEAQRRRFEQTMRFGGEVELTGENVAGVSLSGPKELGLDTFPLGGMRVISPREELSPPLRAQLAVQHDSGVPLISLPLEFTRRESGLAGATLHGRDIGGFLEVRLRGEPGSGRCSLTFSADPPSRSLPQTLVPVLRLISSMHPGRTVALSFAGDTRGRLHAQVGDSMVFDHWSPDDATWWADAFEDLVRLQSRTGHFFPVPDDFTKADAIDVKEVLALLSGDEVTLQGRTMSVDVTSSEALEQLAAPPGQMCRLQAEYEGMTFRIGEHEIELGPGVDTYTMDKVLNLDEAQRELSQSGQATVRLRIAARFPATRRLRIDPLASS